MTRPDPPRRNVFWTAAGLGSLAVGIIGIFLPLLPTTPLVLLAAFCFARGSPRLHTWLVQHPRFGPAIQDWQDKGAVSPRAKRMALIAMAATVLISLAFGLPWTVIAIQTVCLSAVATFLVTRPNA